MLRRLLVMRHAKSSWKSGAATDHARPLNARGRGAAPVVAAAMVEYGLVPDAVVASDAQRSRETWARCATLLPAPTLLRFTPTLYGSSLPAILGELRATPSACSTLLIIGHNPTWERLVFWLSDVDVVLKTAHVAVLEAAQPSWKHGLSGPGAWNAVRVLRPR